MAKLVCMSGMNKGDIYNLSEGDNLIGRGEDTPIRLFDKKASRHHGKIIVSSSTLIYKDLKSTNGSRVNNQFVTGAIDLKIGDYIHIGQTVFLVSDDTPDFSNAQVAAANSAADPETLAKLRQVEFTLSDTTNLRKMKKEKLRVGTGYMAFFEVTTTQS